MPCQTCNHPQRHDIDLALLAQDGTLTDLGRLYGLSVSSLSRHKKHLQGKMRRTGQRLQENLAQDTLFLYNELLEAARQHVRTATAAGDSRLAVQAINAGTRVLNAMARLEVRFDPDTTYRLLASPQWAAQDGILPTDPHVRTGTRRAMSAGLASPCPEAALGSPVQASDHAALVPGPAAGPRPDGRAPEPAVAASPASADVSPATPAADPPAAAPLAPSQRQTGAPPPASPRHRSAKLARKKRESTEKAAPKARLDTDNSQQCHIDISSEKKSEKKSAKSLLPPPFSLILAKGPNASPEKPHQASSSAAASPAAAPAPEPLSVPPVHFPDLSSRFSTVSPTSLPVIVAFCVPLFPELDAAEPQPPATVIPLSPRRSAGRDRQGGVSQSDAPPAFLSEPPDVAGDSKAEQARPQRAKSAQVPKKPRFFTKIMKLFRLDKSNKKIAAPGPRSEPPDAVPPPNAPGDPPAAASWPRAIDRAPERHYV